MMRLSALALLGTALVIGGCGYQPLYGVRDDGGSVNTKLANVSVTEQHTRLGQLVRNEIVANISPAGTHGSGVYRLELAPTETFSSLIESSNTEDARLQYRVVVAFALYEGSLPKPVFTGKTFAQVSYDRVDAPAANLQARTNAREQAAREAGLDIRTRLAAYFSG